MRQVIKARAAVLLEPGQDPQLTDVEQEENGVYNYDRSEKFDMKRIHAIFSKEPAL